jgi:hypothetical protein
MDENEHLHAIELSNYGEIFLNPELDAICEEDRERRGAEYGASFCRMLWEEPQINWDGKILGCCCNYWKAFDGNAFTDGLVDVLNSEPITYARLMLQGARPPREDIPCTTCDLYWGRFQSKQWLKRGASSMEFRLRQWLGKRIQTKRGY